MPYQNVGRKYALDNLSMGKELDDNEVCRQILELDPAIRVAAFIERSEGHRLRGIREDEEHP